MLVPCYNNLMAGNEAAQKSPTSSATKDQREVEDLIVNLLRKAAENPVEVIECILSSSDLLPIDKNGFDCTIKG